MEVLGTEDLLGMGEKGEDIGGKEDGEGGGYLLCSPTSCSSHSYCSSAATQMMLCFGRGGQEEVPALMMNGLPLKSSDSSLTTLCSSPPSTTTTCSSSKASKKVETEGRGRRRAAAATTSTTTTTTTTTASSCKKTKTEASARPGTNKVRKEKLGDRVSALQQLVSPFGKTDTASVLHEALGYIRFLHEQVQVLSSPYLQRLPPSAHLQLQARQTSRLNENLQEGGVGPRRSDLRSRGLCLVPVSCTEHMANTSSNGADLWAPVMESSMQPFSSEH